MLLNPHTNSRFPFSIHPIIQGMVDQIAKFTLKRSPSMIDKPGRGNYKFHLGLHPGRIGSSMLANAMLRDNLGIKCDSPTSLPSL